MRCPKCNGVELRTLETRELLAEGRQGTATRRRKECQNPRCKNRFSTYEVDDIIWRSVKQWMQEDERAAPQRFPLFTRNEELVKRNKEIVRRYEAGEKAIAITHAFNLAPGGLYHVLRKYNVPLRSPQRAGYKRKKLDTTGTAGHTGDSHGDDT